MRRPSPPWSSARRDSAVILSERKHSTVQWTVELPSTRSERREAPRSGDAKDPVRRQQEVFLPVPYSGSFYCVVRASGRKASRVAPLRAGKFPTYAYLCHRKRPKSTMYATYVHLGSGLRDRSIS